MAIKLADAFIQITADATKLDASLKQAENRTKAFGGIMQGVLQGIGQRLFDATAGALGNLIGAISAATTAASDLNETVNKTSVVFGESAKEILEWSKTSAEAFGQSQRQALEAATSFGSLFVVMGNTRAEAAEMSKIFVELASDIASFNNISPEAALTKLQSGLAGEVIPLRSVQVFLNEHLVAQKAVQLGMAETTAQVSEQAKVMARYQLILEQTVLQQGDFVRTAGDLANASRTLRAQLETLQAQVGQAFLPIKTAFVQGLSAIVTAVQPFAQQIIANLARGLAAGIRYITPALMALRALFTFWLKPGSPPKLLPDLVEWGMAAASEWVSGWAKADLGGLQQLGSAIEGILRSFAGAGRIKETDLVSRILGSRDAISAAIAEFRQVGVVSEDTLDKIKRAAGPAGDAIAKLISAYFDLTRANERVQRAQENLNRITERYDAIIDPLTDRLDSVREAQRKLADDQRKIQLQNVLLSFDSSDADKRAAQLELQQIALEDQIATEEQRKKAATDTAQVELDAAEKGQQIAQDKFDTSQALLQQQMDRNNLIAEEMQLQERLRQEREAAAKAAQAEAEQLQAAILQYQLGLTDTQGKIALLRGELSKTQEGSAEYYQLLTQISALEQQAAEEAKRNAEQVADAQFAYQLQIGDTQADLELLRAKLATVKKDSVEYFQLLTEIAAKEQELAREGAAGLGSGLPEIMGPTGEPLNPTDLLDPETKAAVDDLVRSIKAIGDTSVEISPGVQRLATSIGNVVTAIGLLLGIDFTPFQKKNNDATSKSGMDWANYQKSVEEANAGVTLSADQAAEDMADTADTVAGILQSMKAAQDLTSAALAGDWNRFWADLKILFANSGLEIKIKYGTFLGDLLAATISWIPTVIQWWKDLFIGIGAAFTAFIDGTKRQWGLFLSDLADLGRFGIEMYNAGTELLTSLWDGLKSKWKEISDWWSGPNGVWTGFRAVLPFSEPKDPTSPLRGLDKAGESIINQIRSGMEAATAGLNGAVGGLAPTTNNNLGGVTVMQNFYGSADAPTVRQAAGEGLSQALRAAGVI